MIKDKFCRDLTISDMADLKELFMASFNSSDAQPALNHYTSSIEKVLVMYESRKPAAFLFYQLKKVAGANVLHLSLSGKNTNKSGAQKKMGSYLFYRYVLNPFSALKLNAFVTVSNNPRSYFNMRAIGDAVFPDVLASNKKFKYKELYGEVASELGLKEVDEKGILHFRMQKLGFQIREEQTCKNGLDRKGLAFMDYIDDDASHGVLVMVCVRPIVDVPLFYLSEARKMIISQSAGLKQIVEHRLGIQ